MNGIPDEDQGEWELCPIREPKPKPDVCPSGTYRIINGETGHYHWRRKASEPPFEDTDPVPPEVYWWMGCVVIIAKKRDDGTAKTFVFHPVENKYWWKTQDYPLPAAAQRVSFPDIGGSEDYRRGFGEGYATAWSSRSEIVEILLSEESISGPPIPTDKLALDPEFTYDSARLASIAEILGIEVKR